MTRQERLVITDLEKCDFRELHAFHKDKVEARKALSKEEKQVTLRLLPPLISSGNVAVGFPPESDALSVLCICHRIRKMPIRRSWINMATACWIATENASGILSWSLQVCSEGEESIPSREC